MFTESICVDSDASGARGKRSTKLVDSGCPALYKVRVIWAAPEARGDRLLLCLSDSTATELVGNDELAWKDKATLVIEQVNANVQGPARSRALSP